MVGGGISKSTETVLFLLVLICGIQLLVFHGNLQLFSLAPEYGHGHLYHSSSTDGATHGDAGSPWNGHVDRNFWNLHFVKQVGGPYSSSMVHIHHACVKGNTDGIYVSDKGSINDATGDAPYRNSPVQLRPMSEKNADWLWNCSLREPLDGEGCVRAVQGVTLMCNCWRQNPSSTNSMHMLHQVVHMFELGSIHARQKETMAIRNTSLPFFQHLALHQCPSHTSLTDGKWAMGTFLWSIVRDTLARTGLWLGESPSSRTGRSSVVDLSHRSDWTCFEDLYLDRRFGSMAPMRSLAPAWQAYVLETVGIQGPHLTDGPDLPRIRERCNDRRMRIHIFQRKQGDGRSGDRAFRNLADVVLLAQNFTEERIQVVTTDGGMHPREQAGIFRGFDILITPHGSHLMNMLFQPPYTGIIEVAPVDHDPVFSKGARQLGIQSYRFSTGHQPACPPDTMAPEPLFEESLEINCTYDSEDGLGWTCPRALSFQYVVCDMVVDIEKLRNHIVQTLKDLCTAG